MTIVNTVLIALVFLINLGLLRYVIRQVRLAKDELDVVHMTLMALVRILDHRHIVYSKELKDLFAEEKKTLENQRVAEQAGQQQVAPRPYRKVRTH